VSVPAGATVSRYFTDKVDSPLPANTTRVANLATTTSGDCLACEPANPTVPVLDAVKSVATVNGAPATDATQVAAGDVITYQIAVTNTGGSVGATTLSDAVPASTTYTGVGEGWSCTAPAAAGTGCTQQVSVPVGGTVTRSYTVTVDKPLAANVTTIANLATTTTGTCSDCEVENPTVPVLDTIKQVLTVNGAEADEDTRVLPGDTIVYAIEVTNTGGSTGTTTLSDAVPVNTTYTGAGEGWSCAAPAEAGAECTQSVEVAAGATVTVEYTLEVIDPLPAGVTRIANMVTTTDGTCVDCTPQNPVDGADVAVTKSVDRTVLIAGQGVTYTIGLTNLGPYEGRGVVAYDPIPAFVRNPVGAPDPAVPGSTCTTRPTTQADLDRLDPAFGPYTLASHPSTVECAYAAIAVGQKLTQTVRGSLDPALVTPQSVVRNEVVATSTTYDPDLSNNRAAVSTPAVPDVQVLAEPPLVLANTGAAVRLQILLAVLLLGIGLVLMRGATGRRRRA
jgi:uncharacterized repeat protein (TIGR01451 family)